MHKKYLGVCSLIAVGIVLLDQYVKQLYSNSDALINTGVSFGFFSGPLLSILLLGVLAILLYFLVSTKAPVIPAGMLLGGASSNILDRFLLGGVKDIFAVPILNVYNNLADWAIAIAVLWIVLWQFRQSRHYESNRL